LETCEGNRRVISRSRTVVGKDYFISFEAHQGTAPSSTLMKESGRKVNLVRKQRTKLDQSTENFSAKLLIKS
jgi:hypothetical protein